MGGQPEVEAGGALAAGDPLTSDTEGKAVKATEGGSRIIGFAMTGAAAGDIITYIYAPGTLGVAAAPLPAPKDKGVLPCLKEPRLFRLRRNLPR